MPPSPNLSPLLGPLGVSAGDEQVYRRILRRSPVRLRDVAEASGAEEEEVDRVVDRLVEGGLVRRARGFVVAVPPESLLTAAVEDETSRLKDAFGRLESLRAVLPTLISDHQASAGPAGHHVLVETAPFEQAVPVIQELAAESAGDLLWLRPDQWRIEAGRQVDDWLIRVLAGGRQSRVIYPARVLEEAPEVVRGRAGVGESVRVLAAVPARAAVFGTSAAVIQEGWPASPGRLLVLRHPALVEMVTRVFELLWERAVNVPGVGGRPLSPERLGARRLLLDQLAHGAKDEQIARDLRLSLRTVRRRVAELMDELGADSRFQAGVEAVRRGWL